MKVQEEAGRVVLKIKTDMMAELKTRKIEQLLSLTKPEWKRCRSFNYPWAGR